MTTPLIDLTPRLRLAADYLHEHGWTTGTEKNGQGQVCLTGAIRYCAPQTGDEYLIREVLRKRGRAESWNDNQATAGQVEEYLRTAEVTDADLADTFGPEWRSIVAIVRRATTITPAEATRLVAAPAEATRRDAARAWARAAAWDAAWDAARDAARAAAWDAAGDAAGDAAWDAAGVAAGDAARDAAGVAAGDAARDASIRDLIGQHGFTQDHYDTLTGPWRMVIGKVHPDDADLLVQKNGGE